MGVIERRTDASAAPLVSVIVPVRNGVKGIDSLLGALERQTLPPRLFEVILVDDASSDGTAEAARGRGVEVVSTPSRLGSYGARNEGISAARADTLAFTDGDCAPEPTWLEHGLHDLDDLGADLLAGHIAVPLGRRPSKAAVVDAALHLHQRAYVEFHDFGATANLFVRHTVFERIGRFNCRLRSGGDTEFGQRAVAAGLRLRYTRRAVTVHAPREARELARKAYRLGFGSAQHGRYAEGPLAARQALWKRPKAWLPARRPLRPERLAERNYHPTRRELVALRMVHWLCFRLPIAAGSLAGSVVARVPAGARRKFAVVHRV